MSGSFRIASLCPSNTELLCALGLSEYLVGVDLYSDFPPDVVKSLPRLGPDLQIDMDALCALKPDLVVSSLSVPGMERVVLAVQERGLRQLTLAPQSLHDILEDARRVADALPSTLRSESAVQQVTERMSSRMARAAEATQAVARRPRLYFEWWPKPVFSPGSENWLTELAYLAGGSNVFCDEPGAQVQADESQVIAASPDVFLAVWTGVLQEKVPLAKIKGRSGWEQTPMFRNKRLFILSEGLFCRPSPRLLDGLEQLLGLLHPDIAHRLGLQPPASYGPIRDWEGRWWSATSQFDNTKRLRPLSDA